jgi:hypothetical protein
MGINAKKIASTGGSKGPKQEPIDAGTYPVRVAQILDLGLQPQRPFQGQEKPPAHELMITYEFLDEFCLDEDGNEDETKPRWLSETLPLRSLQADRAKSTQRYYALDPSEDFGGDFGQLVGMPAVVTIVQNAGKGKNAGNVYNNITALSSMRPKDASKAPDLVNPPKVLDLDEPDMEIFGSLPDWIQDKIKANLEFNGSALQRALGGEPAATDDNDDGGDDDWS